MNLARLLHSLGEKADGWRRDGPHRYYLRAAQFRSLEDVKAVGDELGSAGDFVAYFLGYKRVTLEQLATTADTQITQFSIVAYEEDPGENALKNGLAAVHIANKRDKESNPGQHFLAIHIAEPATRQLPSGALHTFNPDKLASLVERAFQQKWPYGRGDYPVVDTVDKKTLHTRNHDRKVRVQAAVISLLTSGTVTIAVKILFPGKT